MLLVQKWPFFQFFFLAIVGQENVFYDILEPTNTFLGYKNEKFKKSKNWHFSKGLSHALGQKIAIFPTFFLRQYRPRKSLLRYFRTKKHLSRLKKLTVKKVKKLTFQKKVNPRFRSKNGHFSNIFFWQYRPGKFLLQYSGTK